MKNYENIVIIIVDFLSNLPLQRRNIKKKVHSWKKANLCLPKPRFSQRLGFTSRLFAQWAE